MSRIEMCNFYVVVNFFLFQVIFIFAFVSTSLAYITIPKNKRKTKINYDIPYMLWFNFVLGSNLIIFCFFGYGKINDEFAKKENKIWTKDKI